MSIKIGCECVYQGRRFDLTIADGDVTVMSGGRRLDIDDLEGVPLTVEALFDFAATWATFQRSHAAFDDDLGYPTRVAVDPHPMVPRQAERFDVVAFNVP